MDKKSAKQLLKTFLFQSGYDKDQVKNIVGYVSKNILAFYKNNNPKTEKTTKQNDGPCLVNINATKQFGGSSSKGMTQMTPSESAIADESRGAGPRT